MLANKPRPRPKILNFIVSILILFVILFCLLNLRRKADFSKTLARGKIFFLLCSLKKLLFQTHPSFAMFWHKRISKGPPFVYQKYEKIKIKMWCRGIIDNSCRSSQALDKVMIIIFKYGTFSANLFFIFSFQYSKQLFNLKV